MASHLSRSAIAQNEKEKEKTNENDQQAVAGLSIGRVDSPRAARARTNHPSTAAAAPLGGPRRHLPANQKPLSIPPAGERRQPGEGEEASGMAAAASPTWVFGYGSLIWNPGFAYDARVVGFVRDYRRVFYQGNTSYPPARRGRAIAGLFVPALSFFSLRFLWPPDREHGPQGHAAVPREDRHARAPSRSDLRTILFISATVLAKNNLIRDAIRFGSTTKLIIKVTATCKSFFMHSFRHSFCD